METATRLCPAAARVALARGEAEVLEAILGLIEDNRDRYDADAPWLDDIDRLWVRLHLALKRRAGFRPTAREAEVIRDVLTEGTPWENLFADDETRGDALARLRAKFR